MNQRWYLLARLRPSTGLLASSENVRSPSLQMKLATELLVRSKIQRQSHGVSGKLKSLSIRWLSHSIESCNGSSSSLWLKACREELASSTHWWRTPSPACFQHRLPRLNRVMPQHSPLGLRDWIVRWSPVKSPYWHPLGMLAFRVRFELHDLLLVGVQQPAFTTWLFRWWIGGMVFLWHRLMMASALAHCDQFNGG